MSAPFLHPTAVIDGDVEIENGAKVWHFCHLSSGAHIGPDTSLGQNVFVGEGVRIGARVKVQNNVSIYSGVEIDDDVFLGPSVVFTNVKRPRATIDQRGRYLKTRVQRGATIGANATVVCGTTIGAYSFIGAGSVVTKDVPAFALVQGNPAVQVGWVDENGQPAERPPQEERAPLATPRNATELSPLTLPAPTDENEPFQEELEAAATRVLRSGQFIQGPEIEHFEAEVAEFLGARHAVSCSNASDALVMALLASGACTGDEVVTTPYSFFATGECIVRVGAVPVFVDIEPDSFHLDLDLVLGALTARTKAVLVVHLFGKTQGLTELRTALQGRNVCLIEDAAQAFGARTDSGKMVGAESQFACFSFFPSKNLGGFGDGGLVTTDDEQAAHKLHALRRHGARTPHYHEDIGGNFRMDALQAALLRAKLPHVPALLERRQRNAAVYRELLQKLPDARLALPPTDGPDHTYNQFVVRTPERDALRAHLGARGVECPIYYPTPLHLQPALRVYAKAAAFPNAEKNAREALALPIHPALEAAHIREVARLVLEFFE